MIICRIDSEYVIVKIDCVLKWFFYGPPEGAPLFDTYLDIVTAFLRDSFIFYRINIMLIFMN